MERRSHHYGNSVDIPKKKMTQAKFKKGQRVIWTSKDNYFSALDPVNPCGWAGTVQRPKYPCRGRSLVLVDLDPQVSPEYPTGTTVALDPSSLT
jgi:hypothetical protein